VNLERLYLDYNATSPLSQSVLNWLKSGDVLFANPSSQHSDGKSARKSVNDARQFIFKTFNRSEKNAKLFFHSGATEAIHTFASSFAETARLSGKNLLICYSSLDHPAVKALEEKFFGSHVKFFHLKRDKNFNYLNQENFEFLKDKKENDPDLIILYHHLWVHNETGQVCDLLDLKLFRQIPDIYFHIDSVQAPGKVIDWNHLSEGDIWTYSGHKFGSLKGIGFTLFSASLPYHPLLTGGSQQGSLRSGTENIHGIQSLVLAMDDLCKVDVNKNAKQREKLLTYMKNELNGIGGVIECNKSASNTIFFYLNELSSDIALALFDVHGIEISAGSACSSGTAKDSEVLLHCGLRQVAKNALRLSMGFDNSEETLNKIFGRLRPVFNKLR
jgi:cysteine desulfurase